MPLYRCLVAPGLTTFEQRARIAQAITRIHCDVTGGLPGFVHAFFREDAKGELPAGRQALVFGGIRAGRSPAQKAQLVSEMQGEIAEIIQRSEDAVLVATADIPARWVMEGGDLLPEPGEEAAWNARHAR